VGTSITHIWKPSSARTVVIDNFVPVPRGTTATAPAFLNWPTKDPGDTLDYQLDITPAVIGNPGDSIATIGVSISPSNPGDLSMNSMAADGSRAVFWFTEGQSGTTYTITVLISTTSGRTIQRSVLLPVLYLSAPYAPPDALDTNTGSVVTDQNGNPILALSS
jgi:hypothetical protein